MTSTLTLTKKSVTLAENIIKPKVKNFQCCNIWYRLRIYVTELRRYRTPEDIKLASMHSTNKAFERYYRVKRDDIRKIYQDTRTGPKMAKKIRGI